jgi:hypothetical protein
VRVGTIGRHARLLTIALVVIALSWSAGAVMYAAASSSTIKACVKTSGSMKGYMRMLESGKCASGEKLVAWNQQGPQGPTGAQGPAGGGGISLPLGYFSSPGVVAAPGGSAMDSGAKWIPATVEVAPGTYLVSATGGIYGGTLEGGRNQVTCSIRGEGRTVASLTGTFFGSMPYSLGAIATVSARSTLTVECSVPIPASQYGNARSALFSISAVQVQAGQ